MSSHTQPETDDALPHGAGEGACSTLEDTAFYCEMLDEVMQTALDVARMIRTTLQNEPATIEDHATAALAMERIARILRRGILLVCKLQEGRPVRVPNARLRTQARRQVHAEMEAAKAAQDRDPTRPDRPEPLDSLPPGTVPEIIAGLCHDLAAIATQRAHPTTPIRWAKPTTAAPQTPTAAPRGGWAKPTTSALPKAHHRRPPQRSPPPNP